MAEIQHATPPAWLGRSWWSLLFAAVGGVRQNVDKIRQLFGLLFGYVRPGVVRRRLQRLRDLGHVDVIPTNAQLLVAARDQMMLAAAEETRIFYRSQGIPWIFHNLRRFIAGPATMLDPMGLFSPRDTIIHHVLQTFHRHPIYDVILLHAYPGENGDPDATAEMERQARQLLQGEHPHQAALSSLIEDGSYHARLPDDIAAIRAHPDMAARPIPEGLVDDAYLMLGMDQFKDIRGFTAYAARLRAGTWQAIVAWLGVAWNETLGGLLRWRVGPRHVLPECCDPDLVRLRLPGVGGGAPH